MTDGNETTERARYTNPSGGEQTGVGGLGRGPGSAGRGDAETPIGGRAGLLGTAINRVGGRGGGWWGGDEARRAAEDMERHEPHYREHFRANRTGDVEYEDARIGYGLGHVAARHPEHRGRGFDEIEDALRSSWSHERHAYDAMRPYVREGYVRSSEGNPLA